MLIHWSLLDVHVSCTEEYNLTKMLLYISCRRRWCHFNGLLGTPLSSHVIPAPWLIKYAMLTRHHLFSCFFFLFVEDEQSAPACPPLSPLVPPFSPSPYMCYLPVAIPPGTNLWPLKRERVSEKEGGRETESRRPRGWLGVDGQLPAPSTKPAMGTTTSIHIQILPGRRKREAIDCGMEG